MIDFIVQANIVDIEKGEIYFGQLEVINGKIISINKLGEERIGENYLLPGFIDSHVHIESSMLVPSEFARLAVVHGTVGTISDPHEIANVCGMEGVKYMIENSKSVPFKCTFGAPSCVPATSFETAGAVLNVADVTQLLDMPEIKYLSEMMNFPGVLFKDEDIMKKIQAAHQRNKPVDGHAPGLRGQDAKNYIAAGITTDHECFSAEEALDKLQNGMKILIREGSAAKNFEALINLMHEHHDNMMFCSDDKHPDSLVEGHINQLCARAVAKGIDVYKVLKAACINPVKHYKMDVGLLQINDPADFILIKDLKNFEVVATYINGIKVAEHGKTLIDAPQAGVINQFNCKPIETNDLKIIYNNEKEIPVIVALDGQLITPKRMVIPKVENNEVVGDVTEDILKMIVVNRYHPAPVAKAFIKNIGLKKGALASTVAHDSHNIVAVGTSDEEIVSAVNALVKSGGGVSAVLHNEVHLIELPVGGLMSNKNGYEVAEAYTRIDRYAKNILGSTLASPFMTLSFMALLVIPHLKLSDKGLFDGDQFALIPDLNG